jgi:hypothetical protein
VLYPGAGGPGHRGGGIDIRCRACMRFGVCTQAIALPLDTHPLCPGIMPTPVWLRVACGLGTSHVGGESWASLDPAVFRSVCVGLLGGRDQSNRDRSLPRDHPDVAMEPFYCALSAQQHSLTFSDRVGALRRLSVAMGGLSLAALMAPDFLALWTPAVVNDHVRLPAEH